MDFGALRMVDGDESCLVEVKDFAKFLGDLQLVISLAGREMGGDGEFMRFVTASLKVDFLRPTPIGVELVIRGQLRAIEGRKVQLSLSLSAGGQACAKGEMLAVQFRD